MRNNGTGGMRTNATSYSIICPQCGKPAYRKDEFGAFDAYHHFTKSGTVRHVIQKKTEDEQPTVDVHANIDAESSTEENTQGNTQDAEQQTVIEHDAEQTAEVYAEQPQDTDAQDTHSGAVRAAQSAINHARQGICPADTQRPVAARFLPYGIDAEQHMPHVADAICSSACYNHSVFSNNDE